MKPDILTADQLRFLERFSGHHNLVSNFYLSGGTALAGFYLGHRYSEDLDFFSEKEIDPLAIDVFLKTERKALGVSQIDYQQSYNRNLYFLNTPQGVLKAEFTYFPFLPIVPPIEWNGVRIDSIRDIAVNKLFTIYQRTNARDFIDLYAIVTDQQYELSDVVAQARIKFDWHIDPLQLGTQFIKSKDAADVPRMIADIAPEAWRAFFREEARKLAPVVLK